MTQSCVRSMTPTIAPPSRRRQTMSAATSPTAITSEAVPTSARIRVVRSIARSTRSSAPARRAACASGPGIGRWYAAAVLLPEQLLRAAVERLRVLDALGLQALEILVDHRLQLLLPLRTRRG